MADSQQIPPVEEPVDSEQEEDEEQQEAADAPESAATGAAKRKKKKSKKAKVAAALGLKKDGDSSKPATKMSDESIQALLDHNPSLKGELSNLPPEKAREVLRKMDVSQLLTGLSLNKTNQKDMASHKFWQTQPVVKFDEKIPEKGGKPDGPIQQVSPDKVPKDPAPLPDGYEWVEIDLLQQAEIEEVYKLLTNHYVEDDNAMFRFAYSQAFFDWALKAPGWRKSWHIGVRAKGPKRLLVATIFGIPTKLRVRDHVIDVVEINWLCIHKKLRSKRLTPVMIKEITRRCNLEGIYQAIYTGGVVLPTPVSTCRYFHRPLDWLKLNTVGFSPLPPKTTPAMMIKKNQLPTTTSTKGWREMEKKDTDAVLDLLSRYLQRFQLAQELSREEIEHWFLDSTTKAEDRVVWAFVVENDDGKITDFTSFYSLESSVIGATDERYSAVRAAYLFYYASETAFNEKEQGLKERLREINNDMLIEAKQAKFDVFNALTLHDNPLFLEALKFGPGDGQLHYYLYNWRTAPVSGGIGKDNMPDERARGGNGMILL